MSEFTHFNAAGEAIMVDVGEKDHTMRTAIAEGTIEVGPECFRMICDGSAKKGDVLGVARVAGIMGAKKTADLIPLCHRLNLTKVEITFSLEEETSSVTARCEARCVGQTGVEMEALTGVQIALLTIYDMCKAVTRGMVMRETRLLQKDGGKSGHWEAKEQ